MHRNAIKVYKTDDNGDLVCLLATAMSFPDMVEEFKLYQSELNHSEKCGNISAVLLAPDDTHTLRTNAHPLHQTQVERVLSSGTFQLRSGEESLHKALKSRRSIVQQFLCPRSLRNDTTQTTWTMPDGADYLFAAAYHAHAQSTTRELAQQSAMLRLASLLMVLGSIHTRRRVVPCQLHDSKHYSPAVRSAAWGDNCIQVLADAGLAASTVSQAQLLNTVPETDPRIIDVLLEQVCLIVSRIALAHRGRSITSAQLVHKVDEQGSVWFCGATRLPVFGSPTTELDLDRVKDTARHYFSRSALRELSLVGGVSAATGSASALVHSSMSIARQVFSRPSVAEPSSNAASHTVHPKLEEALKAYGHEYRQLLQLHLPFPEPPTPHQAVEDLELLLTRRLHAPTHTNKQPKFAEFWSSIQPKDILLAKAKTKRQLGDECLLRWLAWRHVSHELHSRKVRNDTAGAIAENTHIPRSTLRLMETTGEQLDGGAVNVKPLAGPRPEAFDMSNLGQIGQAAATLPQAALKVHQEGPTNGSNSGLDARYGALSKFSLLDSHGLSPHMEAAQGNSTFTHLVNLQPIRLADAKHMLAIEATRQDFASNQRKSSQKLAQLEAQAGIQHDSLSPASMASLAPHGSTSNELAETSRGSWATQSTEALEDSLYGREAAVLSRGQLVSALLDSPVGHRTKHLQLSPESSFLGSFDSQNFSRSSLWDAAVMAPNSEGPEPQPLRDDRHPYERVQATVRERRAFTAQFPVKAATKISVPASTPQPVHSTGSFALKAAHKARHDAARLWIQANALPPVTEAEPLSREAQKQVRAARKQLAAEQGVHHSALPTFGASQLVQSRAKAQSKRPKAQHSGHQQKAAHSRPFTTSTSHSDTISTWAAQAMKGEHARFKAARREARQQSKHMRHRVVHATARVPSISKDTYKHLLGERAEVDRRLWHKAEAAFGQDAHAALQQARERAQQLRFG